tara:strand:+ start:13535 stop:16210 length:2676 start_codon:yes stop_codon:yes gene_type:complete
MAEEENNTGSSFGESFAPVVNALESAYDAWVDAGKNRTVFVAKQFDKAFDLVTDAGGTIGDVADWILTDSTGERMSWLEALQETAEGPVAFGELVKDTVLDGANAAQKAFSWISDQMGDDDTPGSGNARNLERLEALYDEAKEDLEKRKTTDERLGAVELRERQTPFLRELDLLDGELLDHQQALQDAQDRVDDSVRQVRSLTNQKKQAEAWQREALPSFFIPASDSAKAELVKEWNDAARDLFGFWLVDEAEYLTSERSLGSEIENIRDLFAEELARLDDEISSQETFTADGRDELTEIQRDIRSTERDINSTNFELENLSETDTQALEDRLDQAPDLEGLSSQEKQEAIVSWMMDGGDSGLSYESELEDLLEDETVFKAPLRKLVDDNRDRLTRERISAGDRQAQLSRDTTGSPEALRRAAVTDSERQDADEPFSPEAVRRQAAQDRRDRAAQRSDRFVNDPSQRARTRETDPNRSGQFGGGRADVFAEDTEPFANTMDPGQRMRSRRPAADEPISRRMVGAGVGGPLEAGERDRFTGPFTTEEDEEEKDAQIVEDDGTPSVDGPTGSEEGDGAIREDADADADVNLASDATATFILENFGLTSFFLDRDDMLIEDPETGEPVNVLKYIERTGKTNDEEVLGLISQTKWYQDTGPTARAFEREWSIAGEAGREELLDETADLISREAKKIGLTLSEEQLYALSFNAKMMGMDQYEIRQEFVDNWELSFDSEAVQAGNIAALRNKVNQTAGKYMLLLDDDALADAAESLYLGESTIEGLEAGFRNQAIEQMPELGGLIKQGYTPQMYFSSYKSQAERLLERKIDFMGEDRNMFINLMGGQQDDTYIQKPLTLTQANRYFRGLDEWKYTRNATQEARGMADQVGRMFGAVA